MSEPIVEVAQGKLKGKVQKTPNDVNFYSFKGIPYAKPPLGELRFAIPEPPEPWSGIKDATKDVNACPQYFLQQDIFIGNEDCLYLNVYTPELPNNNDLLPVMVYIHGGGFVMGQGTDEANNGPEYLMEKGIVLVSINYRLGILGFLSLDCKDAQGNMGLRDQVQALKWIQQTISKFNGDPNNVTIFGMSAGGASVEYLMLSPTARGLFHKAIAQSGSSLCQWAQSSKVKELAYKTAALNGKEIKDDQELLEYLKGMDVTELVVTSMKASATDEFKGGLHFGFVPVIEKPKNWEPFLDKNTYDLLKSGQFAKVPFMAGFASREGLLMLGFGSKILEKVVKENKFIQSLPFDVDSDEELRTDARLKIIYKDQEDLHKDSDAFGIDYFTDIIALGAVCTATSLISKNNDKPVYFYEFSFDGSFNQVKRMFNIDREGACHGDDIGYLFKVAMLSANNTPTVRDDVIRDRIVTMWTNFAKFGNPTPKVDKLIPIRWDPVSVNAMPCLVINDELSIKKEVYPERMKLFRELYETYLPAL